MRIAERKESPIIGLTGMGGGLTSYILYGSSGSGSGSEVYEISRSLRFDDDASAYLSRNVTTEGNRRKWTWSGWVKRSSLGVQYIWGNADASALNGFMLRFESSDAIRVSDWGASSVWSKVTTAVFRDVSAWYHIVVSYDTENATAADKVKLYVNGSRITDFSTNGNPSDYYEGYTNAAQIDSIGRWGQQAAYYLDGYLADIHFVDGQALDETSFGDFDNYGIWNPKEYTGTYVDWFDKSQTWSSNTTGTFAGTNLEVNAFNGILTSNSSTGRVRPSNGTTAGFTFSGLGTVTSLRIWVHQGGTGGTVFTVNGTDVTSTVDAATNSSFVDFGSTFSSLNAITFNALDGSNWYSIAGIEVNGKLLIDSNLSFANNSYRLNFSDSTSTSTLGADSSGTSNNWTLNSFSVASGSGNDSLLDSPTNYLADSGNNGGNYCTFNALDLQANSTLSNGNLNWLATGQDTCRGTIGVSSGKWYFEFTYDEKPSGGGVGFGILEVNEVLAFPGYTSAPDGYLYYSEGSTYTKKYYNGSAEDYGTDYAVGDVISVALDLDAGTITFYKNGTSQGQAYSSISGTYAPAVASGTTNGDSRVTLNAGQRPFAYTPPAGYLSLCTQNLSTPAVLKGSEQMDIKLYEGNGTSQTITGLEFSPDFIWIKNRDDASEHHAVFDTVRGKYNVLYPSIQNSEANQTNGLTSFTSDGWSVGSDGKVNKNTNNTVGWAWNAGDNSNRTYNVTVVSDGGNKYRFNGHGTSAVTLELEEGSTYVFDSSDSSVDGHPFVLGTSANGDAYSTGVTYTLDGVEKTYSEYTTVSDFNAATTRKLTITVPASAPTLYYWCSVHSGMGGQINTNETAGSSVLSGSLNSSAYDQSQTWSSMLTAETSGSVSNPTYAFDGTPGNTSSTSARTSPTSTQGGIIFTPTGGYTVTSQIRVYGGSATDECFLDFGSGYGSAISLSSGAWNTVYTGSGTLSALKVKDPSGANASGIGGIEIDGKILVDQGVTPPAVPSLNSVVRANPTAGFSIVSYTGGGTAGNIAHGLNAVPEMIMVKNRDDGDNGAIYHVGTGTIAPQDYFMTLFAAAADGNNARDNTGSVWNDTAPTSIVFSVGTEVNVNFSTERYIAYCFAPVEGYSAFGSYTGNGLADGPFVYTGMAPKFILFKRSDGDGDNWTIFDTERDSVILNIGLQPNVTTDEQTFGNRSFEVKSNGFKVTSTGTSSNGTGQTYIWAAFAEHPLKNARAV